MNNAKSLLDMFLNQGSGQASAGEPGQGAGDGQGGVAGQLSSILSGGGAGGGAGGTVDAVRQAAGNFDLSSMLSGKGGLITGAAAGGLAGLLLGGKKPRKIAGTALKVGGIALVGGLAYKAFRDYQANKSPAAAHATSPAQLPSPQGTPFLPDAESEQEDLSLALIRAMIAAAKADGHIDDNERAKIVEQLGAVELDASQSAFIQEELAKPLDVGAVAASGTTPERAAEIYAASLLVIDTAGPAEQGYLAMLAARLKLDPQLVAHLHANAAGVTGEA